MFDSNYAWRLLELKTEEISSEISLSKASQNGISFNK